MSEVKYVPGRGLDVGTGFLVQARMDTSGQVYTKSVRDSFLEIKPTNKMTFGLMRTGLIKAGVNFFEDEDSFFILGEDSLTQSIEKQQVVRRPMSRGVISPKEIKALPMFKALLKELLGDPIVPNESIIYSVPASPADAPFDIVYHEGVIESILSSLGYSGRPMNEAMGIVFSDLGDEGDDYTGVGISLGAGMANIAIANLAEVVTSFSISKGGDYIDNSAAVSLGYDPKNAKDSDVTPSLVTYMKEQGVDLLSSDSSDKVKLAIVLHYRNLIKYIVSSMVKELNSLENKPKFLKPVKVVVSGGTSLATNFMTVFTEELKNKEAELPFKVKDIVHSAKPLTSVAEGCLLALMSSV